MLGKRADANIADRRPLDHYAAHGRHLDDGTRNRILLLCPVAQDAQDDIRPRFTANAQSDLLALHLARRRAVHGQDLVSCAQTRRLAGRPLKNGDDLHRPVLEPHRHADAAEGALGMLAQLLEHIGRHVDGMRIAERCDHAVDRSVDERRRIGCAHIACLYELHHAKEAQNIIAVDPRHAQEAAGEQDGQHTPKGCGQDDG